MPLSFMLISHMPNNPPINLNQDLKKTLDRFYREYDFKARIIHDPIEIPRRYPDPADAEIAGLIAASLAYGKVTLFKPVIERILSAFGSGPAEFMHEFSLKRHGKYLSDISYRFNRTDDLLCFVFLISRAVRQWGSLAELFYKNYSKEDMDIRPALSGFIGYFLSQDTSEVYGSNVKPRGLTQLLSDPTGGSACKRLNLYLRWMVRNQDIDLGLWDRVSPSQLIIPLDTHIARISRCIGLTQRAASDWKAAKEITDSLKQLDAEDPLKYDFALCHHGISGACRGADSSESCQSCVFMPRGGLKM